MSAYVGSTNLKDLKDVSPETLTHTPALQVKSVEMHHEQMLKAGPGDNVGFNVKVRHLPSP